MLRTIRNFAMAALPLAGAAAWAQTPDPAPPPGASADFFQHLLQKFDSNGDGRVSLDEYLAGAAARFKAVDAQKRGSVDSADLASSPQAVGRIDRRAAGIVKRLDTAGNGYVTLDEFTAAAQKRFARLDRNGDGTLTQDELAPPRRRRGAAMAPGRGPIARFAQRSFDKLDANRDGVVTVDEYLAAARARYAALDTPHNGKVTADEIASSPKATRRAIRAANRIVARIDSNGDGRVTQDEFIAAAKTRFARLDRNGDGYIDTGEATPRWKRH